LPYFKERLRKSPFYFFTSFNKAFIVSMCASELLIRESVLIESVQVESVKTESLDEVEVSFEHAAKVTNAAINNTFFI